MSTTMLPPTTQLDTYAGNVTKDDRLRHFTAAATLQ